MNLTTVDLAFPIVEGLIAPIDHGHMLLGALKQAVPQLAEVDDLAIHPLRGTPLPQGLLHLRHRERLRVRLPADRIPTALALAGKELRVGSMLLRLGAPSVEVLVPYANLYARTVVVTKSVAKAERTADRRTNRAPTEAELLTHIKARCNPTATVRVLRWRTIRVHGKGPHGANLHVKGAEVVIEGLDDEHSLEIQGKGIGGRRAFGCGIFVNAGVRKETSAAAPAATTGRVDHA